jgi:hypothetical protein
MTVNLAVGTVMERADGANMLAGTVRDIGYHGDTFKLDVAVGRSGGEALKVKVAREHGADMAPGQEVCLTWKARAAKVFPVADGDNLAAGEDGA